MTLRIGISGSHSCGKTTFLNYLKSKHPDYDYICEVAAQIKPEMRMSLETQYEILKNQISEENKYINFISDRTVIDNYAYFELVFNKMYRKGKFTYDEYIADIDIKSKYYTDLIKYIIRKPYDAIIFVDEMLPLVKSPHRNFGDKQDQEFIYHTIRDILDVDNEMDFSYFNKICDVPIIKIKGSNIKRYNELVMRLDNYGLEL